MALNWGKGAEAVSEGLIRQADIGGLMYKQAASVESARKAGELKQQERLWDIQVQIAKEADADYQTILEAIVEAEGANLEITPKLQQRFEDAEIRREQAYAPLGVLSPGGGGRMEHTFAAPIKGLLDVASIEDAKDWRITFGEGKTPPPVNTMFKRILEQRGLTGDKNAEQQLQEQFLAALQQPIKAETTAGALGADIEATGLMSQADQGQGTPTYQSDQPGYSAGVGFAEWWGRGVDKNRERREETRESGRRLMEGIGRAHEYLGEVDWNLGVKEASSELNNEAMQRTLSQMSQQGQQFWKQYMEAKAIEGREKAITTLREAYNALSDADRQLVLQLHAAGN